MHSGRLLSANALLDDAFAAALSESTYEWEAALQLAEAAATSPAVLTGLPLPVLGSCAGTLNPQRPLKPLMLYASSSHRQPR